ncbi:MAG: hypothetical protein ACYSW6_09370 [Planctomycetota bacterium]|jgi:hypothetical protein
MYTDKELLAVVKAWLNNAGEYSHNEFAEETYMDAWSLADGNKTGYELSEIITNHLGGEATEREIFDCPGCRGQAGIEAVCDGAVLTEQVLCFEDEGYFEVTGDYELHDWDTCRFQCEFCGHVIADSPEEMEKWHKENM